MDLSRTVKHVLTFKKIINGRCHIKAGRSFRARNEPKVIHVGYRFFCTTQSNRTIRATLLPSRAIVRLRGADTIPFLQGLVTNDVNILKSEDRCSLFAFFLNHQGRIVFDTILYKESGDSLLLECDSDLTQTLVSHLKKFRLRKKVEIEAASDLKLCVVWDCSEKSEGKENFGLLREDLKRQAIMYCQDPRLKTAGKIFLLVVCQW